MTDALFGGFGIFHRLTGLAFVISKLAFVISKYFPLLVSQGPYILMFFTGLQRSTKFKLKSETQPSQQVEDGRNYFGNPSHPEFLLVQPL